MVVKESLIESPRVRRHWARKLESCCCAGLKHLLGLAGFALLLIASTPAEACRCRQLGIIEYFTAAELVAEARVVDVSDTRLDGGIETRRYRVETIQVFKGQPVAQIHSHASSATCGVDFTPGQLLWLFAQSGPGTGAASGTALWMNTCSGARPGSAGFIDAEASQVADTLTELARRAGATADEQTPRNRPSTELRFLRRISRDRIDAHARLALQRDAVVSPDGVSRAVVIGPTPNPRPPHFLRLVVENANLDVLEFQVYGRWQLESLAWISDKLLLVVVAGPDAVTGEWVLDTREAELIYSLE